MTASGLGYTLTALGADDAGRIYWHTSQVRQHVRSLAGRIRAMTAGGGELIDGSRQCGSCNV